MSLRELDARQKLLAGVALLLILAHLVFPSAGVDDTSVILLVFLAVVLYGNELTARLAEFQTLAAEPTRARSTPSEPEPAEPEPSQPERAEPEPSEPEQAERPRTQSDLCARVRQVAYQVEHARVAASTEDLPNGGLSREVLDRLWSALEERLRAATGARDSVSAARRLVEGGRAPVQFADAFDAFRKLRNDVGQSLNGDVDEDALWSIVDTGASLMALVPDAVPEESPERSWVP